MSLTSQLITDAFPDLEKVDQLNKEAFPEEERVSLEEFLSYFAIMPHLRSHGYGREIIEKLIDFYQRTMILEVERLDEDCDNLEQRKARMDFYLQNGFKTANAFLEYEGMSFEIIYRGDHFDEEAYRNIFQKLQEENYFDFRIKYRRFSEH